MCNCGSKRNEFTQQAYPLSNTIIDTEVKKKMWPDVKFQYTGNTALTIIGSITGTRYRFAQPNEIQLIDYRDASAMKGVNILKKVS